MPDLIDALDSLVPPNPDAKPDKPDKAPGRPTTRAGRRAAAAAKGSKTPAPDKAPGSSAPRARKATLENRLTDSFTTLGTGLMIAGSMGGREPIAKDGVAVIQQGPGLAKALDGIAKQDPKVAAALERMLTVGTYGALVGALVPLAVMIGMNHQAIPEEVGTMLNIAPIDLAAFTPPEPAAEAPAA